MIFIDWFFSEENIWKLCECWKQNDPDHLGNVYAVFISNKRRQIPMWEQKSASNDKHLVVWVWTSIEYRRTK